MSLPEIQSLISQLTRADRETLLQRLGQQLANEQSSNQPSESSQPASADRSRWLEELRQLREGVATKVHGTPLSDILDDLRADRV